MPVRGWLGDRIETGDVDGGKLTLVRELVLEYCMCETQ